jgi:hypothetical protein
MGLKQGYVAIDDELVRPVPCLLPRRAFNSQRNPLKTSIDEDAGNQWPLGFCRSSRSLAPNEATSRKCDNEQHWGLPYTLLPTIALHDARC